MSEFRKDIVSGEWIIMAPERAKRPHEWPARPPRFAAPIEKCPFEDLEKSGNWPPILALPDKKNWRIAVIPNKFPAIDHHHVCAETFKRGPYDVAQGVGHHEVVITRDHAKNMPKLTVDEAVEVLEVIQTRYAALSQDNCVKYVMGIMNWGPSAGGSLFHPHYQIFALPIVPPEVEHSLHGAKKYYEANKTCGHCVILEYEWKEKKRVIADNEFAVALAPFASANRFEVRIYPKAHGAFFHRASKADIRGVGELLRDTLIRIEKYWKDPDLNFYIHSGPVKDENDHWFYHWHIEIVPKDIIPPVGGFELGTKIDINPIDPDIVAKMLRGETLE